MGKTIIQAAAFVLIITLSACSGSSQQGLSDSAGGDHDGSALTVEKFRFNVRDIEVYDLTEGLTVSDNPAKEDLRRWLSQTFASYGGIGKLKIIINRADLDDYYSREAKMRKFTANYQLSLILELPEKQRRKQPAAATNDDIQQLTEESLSEEIRGLGQQQLSSSDSVPAVPAVAVDDTAAGVVHREVAVCQIGANTKISLKNIENDREISKAMFQNIETALKRLEEEMISTVNHSASWQKYVDIKYRPEN